MKSPLGMAHRITPGLWWTLSLAVALADQAIKYVIEGSLSVGAVVPLTPVFNLLRRYSRNGPD